MIYSQQTNIQEQQGDDDEPRHFWVSDLECFAFELESEIPCAD